MLVSIALFLCLLFCASADARHEHMKGVLTNDSIRCEELRHLLFHPTSTVDEIRFEWERFLPVFVKTQLFDIYKQTGPEMEFPNSKEHARFDMLGPIGPRCRTPIESYGNGDEEKRACGLQQLQKLNQVSTDTKHECVIYSIGSNNQWDFEVAIVQKTDCRVETFDCTVPNARPPEHVKHRVRFHPLCVSDADYELDGRKYVSWKTLNQITGVPTQPTFLKMDIEGYEFPVLKSIVDSGVFLPVQIAVEVHIKDRMVGPKYDHRLVSSMELYAFMNYLYKFGGYYLIDRNDNGNCAHCSEIVLAKLNCQNYPIPQNFKELMHRVDESQGSNFNHRVRESLEVKYYGS